MGVRRGDMSRLILDGNRAEAAVLVGQTRDFSAVGADQFGNDMTITPDWSVAGTGTITAGGVYTAPSGGGETTDTVTATADGLSDSADVAVKAFNASDVVAAGDEFYIGTGTTVSVPQNATKLYLGMHDLGCYTDNFGTMNATLTWDVGGSSTETVPNGCVFFALAPSGAPNAGPWPVSYPPYSLSDPVDSFRPLAVTIPPGATSVTITASGQTWGPGGGAGDSLQARYLCGPDGTNSSGATVGEYCYTISDYMKTAYHSENMRSCECWEGSLVGLFDEAAKLLELNVTDHSDAVNQATATDAAIKDLYVGEDASTQSATIDLSALFAGASGGNRMHLQLKRSDGDVIVNSDYSGNAALSEELPVTAAAHDFTVKATYDPGQGSSPQTREVDVHVVEGELVLYNESGDAIPADQELNPGDEIDLDGNPQDAVVSMDVKLTAPGSVPGKFALVYDDTDIQVFADADCTEPIMSGAPAITPSGCMTVYVKGLADSGGGEISIDLYYCPIPSRGVDAGGAGASSCAVASPLAAPLAQPAAAPGFAPLARAGETVVRQDEILYEDGKEDGKGDITDFQGE